jgi:hypothetical protein
LAASGPKRDRDLQTKNTARIAVTGLGATPLPAPLLLEDERAFRPRTSTLALSNEGEALRARDPALSLCAKLASSPVRLDPRDCSRAG